MATTSVSTTIFANNMAAASGSTAAWISKDGNGLVLGPMSAGFGFSHFGFGGWFLTHGFRVRAPKSIVFGFGFGFSPMDTQLITAWNKNSCFIVYLIITLFT